MMFAVSGLCLGLHRHSHGVYCRLSVISRSGACVRACVRAAVITEKYMHDFDEGNLKERDNLQYLDVDGGQC